MSKSSLTSVRRLSTPKKHLLQPQATPLDERLDERLAGEGLTYLLSITEPGADWEITECNADEGIVLSMLLAARSPSKLMSWQDCFFHHGRNMAETASRRTGMSIKGFAKSLQGVAGLDFILVWHVCGQLNVQLDHSGHLTPHDVEHGLYQIAKELVIDKFR